MSWKWREFIYLRFFSYVELQIEIYLCILINIIGLIRVYYVRREYHHHTRSFTIQGEFILFLETYYGTRGPFVPENLGPTQVRMSRAGSGSQITSPFKQFQTKRCPTYSTQKKNISRI